MDRFPVSTWTVIVWVYERWFDISELDFEDRRRRFRERLGEEDVDAYYTEDLLNLRYLTGFNGTSGGLLVDGTGATGEFVLIVDGRYRNYSERLSDVGLRVELVENSRVKTLNGVLEDLGTRSLHLERSTISYDQFFTFRDNLTSLDRKEYGTNWIEEQRTVKTDEEVERICEAIDQTLDVFELIESWLEPGLTEKTLSRSIRRELESRSEGQSFDPLVLSGPNTANPHCPATDRELCEDDVLLVDQGLKIDGYCSDLTRMFFLGDPDPRFEELYDLSQRAAARAYEVAEAGMSVSAITEAAHELIEEAGYEENLRHGLGHGVGINVHEPPSLSSRRSGELRAGMVVTLEPGIYIDGLGGGRIEHMIQIKENGARLLDRPSNYIEEES